jgi:hypothetical protein
MSAASSTSHMRCELCEGDDHELEDCQIMNPDPETLDQAGSSDSPLAHRMGNSVIRVGGKVQCDDCGVSPFFFGNIARLLTCLSLQPFLHSQPAIVRRTARLQTKCFSRTIDVTPAHPGQLEINSLTPPRAASSDVPLQQIYLSCRFWRPTCQKPHATGALLSKKYNTLISEHRRLVTTRTR